MKFLLDESAEYRIASFLRDHGHDVTAIAHDYPASLVDEDVLSIAHSEQRIVITNDSDFGELVFRDQQPHSGVILSPRPSPTGGAGVWRFATQAGRRRRSLRVSQLALQLVEPHRSEGERFRMKSLQVELRASSTACGVTRLRPSPLTHLVRHQLSRPTKRADSARLRPLDGRSELQLKPHDAVVVEDFARVQRFGMRHPQSKVQADVRDDAEDTAGLHKEQAKARSRIGVEEAKLQHQLLRVRRPSLEVRGGGRQHALVPR